MWMIEYLKKEFNHKLLNYSHVESMMCNKNMIKCEEKRKKNGKNFSGLINILLILMHCKNNMAIDY